MAGNLRKDVELIFRGEDRASPTIKGVRKEVGELTQAIRDQLSAAERGEGSVEALAAAYRDLKNAQGDVTEITKLATAYDNLSRKHAEAAEKAEAARTKEAGLAAQVAAAEAPTKRLIASRDAAARAAQSATLKEQELVAELGRASAALEAVGLDARDFKAAQDTIRQSAVETARAVRDAAAAMDTFKAKQGEGQKANAFAAETAQFNTMAAGSGLPTAQIQFISTLENRMEALALAIREDQASMAALNRELDSRAASDAASRIAAMKTALDDADQAAERLKATTGFRAMAADIEASARDIGRFGPQTDTAAASVSRLAQSMSAILNPTQEAARTLDGVNEIVGRAEASLDGAKRRTSEYNAELNNLTAAAAGLQNLGRLVDDFNNQATAVDRAKASMDAAQGEVLRLASAMQTAETPTKEMADELQRAEAVLERAGAEFQNEATKLRTLETALKAAKIDVNNLETAEQNLTTTTQRLATAQQNLQAKTGGKGNFLGLAPHELTNLGAQFNDIFVSIASGQNPMTVLIQQGAQIGQIIPGAFGAIVKYIPQLTVLGGVLAVLGFSIADVANKAHDLQTAGDILTGMAPDRINTTQQGLAEVADKLRDVEVTGNDAKEAMTKLTAEGFNTAQMEAFVEIVDNMNLKGDEATQMINNMAEAFSGGMDKIIDFAAETGAYTDEQLRMIDSLFEQGRADEARTQAMEIYRQKQQDVADAQSGPWKRAVDQLKGAWDDMTGAIGRFLESIGQRFQNVLSRAAIGVAYLTARLRGYSHEDAGNYAVGNAPLGSSSGGGSLGAVIGRAAFDRAAQMNNPLMDPVGYGQRMALQAAGVGGRTTVRGQQGLRELEREAHLKEEIASGDNARAAAARRLLAQDQARRRFTAMGASDAEIARAAQIAGQEADAAEEQRQRRRDATASRRAQAQARREAAAARAAANRAAAAQRQIANQEEALVRQIEQMDSSVGRKQTENLEVRLSAIDSQYERLFRSLDEYAQRTGGRGMVGDRTIEQARAHIEAQKQELRNYATQEFYEQRLTALTRERGEKLDAIADRVARGLISPEDGLNESQAVITDMAAKINTMTTAAIAFATALRTATPNPQLEAFIAQMTTAQQNNSEGQNVRMNDDLRKAAISAQQSQLQTLIGQREQMVARTRAQVERGDITAREGQQRIANAYAATNEVITRQIALVRGLAAPFFGNENEGLRFFAAGLNDELDTLEDNLRVTDERLLKMRDDIKGLLVTNVVSFIDSIAQAFARLATGQGSVLDFFASIGTAFLDMIAKTLQGIAMLMIQLVVLDAVDKLTGGILKPLLKLYGSSPAVGMLHGGGLAGDAGSYSGRKQVSPLAFAHAPRYHTGGVAGLAPDEVATVLRKNEEVLTEADPRHRFNGGLQPQGGEGKGMRAVLAVGDDQIAQAMQSSAGEDVVLFHLRRNRATVKQLVNS